MSQSRSRSISATLSYKKEKLGTSIFFNRYSSDGYDLNENDDLNTVDPFRNFTINPKLIYDFSDNTNIILTGKYYNQKQEYVASSNLKGETEIDDWNAHIKLNHEYAII